MKTQICKTCKVNKPLSEFYKNSTYLSGYEARCKPCRLADMHLNRMVKREHYATYDKQRTGTPKRRAYFAQLSLRMQKKHPLHFKARSATAHAIKMGRLVRQPCERQPCDQKAEAHHEDYSKPLEVRWLCRRHHAEHHQMKRKVA